jgi:hypothetical protein
MLRVVLRHPLSRLSLAQACDLLGPALAGRDHSRFFEKGLNMPEVAAISGHRDPRMLMRYTHPKPEAITAKL